MARTLRAPRKVARLEAQRAVLQVATANANRVHLVLAHLGHGSGTSDLILSLLLVDVAATTGEAALVARITANACSGKSGGALDHCCLAGMRTIQLGETRSVETRRTHCESHKICGAAERGDGATSRGRGEE